MADDTKTATSVPANRMRLAEKMQKMKNSVTLHTYTEHTEDKGADTKVIEAEHGGNIVGRFVQKDGVTIESMGSADAQQSGDFDAMAKKVGAKDAIVHTKPEQVSEIAHDNTNDSVKDNQKAIKVTAKPKVESKLDNSHEASKEKFINSSTPKESSKIEKSGMHYSTGEQSLSYAKGGVPKAPKSTQGLQKKDSGPTGALDYSKINKIPAGESTASPSLDYGKIAEQKPVEKVPMWKQKMIKMKEELQPKAPRGAIKKLASSEEPLQKKWQVFMESCKNQFADPLKKDPMAKGDVIEFKKPEGGSQVPNTADKMKRIKETAQRIADKKGWSKTNPEADEEGVPHKFWQAFRKQADDKRRRAVGKQIPKPGEVAKDNVVPIKKSSVAVAVKKPSQVASKTPTIKNAEETTIDPKPVKRCEGLAKGTKKPVGSPKIDPQSTPQHLPSADRGLEQHLQDLTTALAANQKKLAIASDKSAYGKDVPREQKEKEIKMADRSLKYLQNGINLTKIAIQARDSKTPNWSSLVGTGNPKVNHMGILTFGNTLPGHNCPARGGCGDGSCYGMNGQQAMGNALELRARNSGLIHRPDFVQGAIQALKNAPKHLNMTLDPETYDHIKDHPRFKSIQLADPVVTDKGVKIKVKAGDYVRWHDTGDILNEKHLDDMVKIAQAFPEKKFYAYTKSMHLPLDKLRAQPNFNVVQSLGGQHNDRIDENKPHAKFFSDLGSAEGAGYTPVWYNDWPAATGVTNIALVPHGSRKKEIDVEGFNKTPDTTPEKIKKSVMPSAHEPAWMTFDQPDSVAQSAAMGRVGKMRAMAMVNHKHQENMAKSDKPKIEIVPHPPEVIDVDPEIIHHMKRRLDEKPKSNVTNIYRAKLGRNASDMDVKREEARDNIVKQNAKDAEKPTLRVVKSTTMGKFEALRKGQPISFSTGTDKLRELRDFVESKGGVAHAKEIKNQPQFRDVKLGTLIDNKGNMTTQSLQSQIDAVPKHNFTASHATIKGTLKHSPAHPDHPQHGQYRAMYGDTGDLIAKQLHSDEPSQVFQLNLSPEHIKALTDAGVMDTFKTFNETSLKSSHPVNPENGVGWVRYTEKPDGIFIDEIQSDLGSSPEKNFDKQASEAVERGAIQAHQVPQMKEMLSQRMPEEHRQKINSIIFGDKHPATVLHEAFHQSLRLQGRENTPIHIWSAAGKGAVSLNNADAPEPVHMKVAYDQNPEKMGFKPATYGDISTQTGPHAGKPTRKTLLRKTKEIKRV